MFQITNRFVAMNTQKTIKVVPSSLYAYSDALAHAGNYHMGPKTAYAIMRNMRFVGQKLQVIRTRVVELMNKHGAHKNEDGSFKQQTSPNGMASPVFATEESLTEYNKSLHEFNNSFVIELPVYMVTDREIRSMQDQVPASVLLGLEPMLIFEDEIQEQPNPETDVHEQVSEAGEAGQEESDHGTEQL